MLFRSIVRLGGNIPPTMPPLSLKIPKVKVIGLVSYGHWGTCPSQRLRLRLRQLFVLRPLQVDRGRIT